MKAIDTTWKLKNGREIPSLGLGFWQVAREDAERVVREGFESGYRHIDTAIAYGNEEEIGMALSKSSLPREAYFLTSKIPAQVKTYEEAKQAIVDSLTRLRTPYLDLMLIHAPKPWNEMRDPSKPYRYEKENVEVYRAMEEAHKEGKILSLGVSNFNVHDMQNIMDHATVPLMVNQIPCYIGNVDDEVIAFAKRNGILIEGYSPLATGQLVHHPEVRKIAEKYGASIPQVCIRFVYQLGALPLPKTTHKEFMLSNAEIDFELSPEDMMALQRISFRRMPTK